MSLKDKAAKIDFGALPSTGGDGRPAARGARTAPGQLMEYAAAQREDLVAQVAELKAKLAALDGEGGPAARAKQLEAELHAAQNELRQWDGAKGVRHLAASEIAPSPFANRHALNFNSAEFEQLLAEISNAGGNVQPIKVRPLSKPRDGVFYEVVYGHRRHEACRRLGLPVLALVDNVDDQVMFIEMDRENRTRLNLSPWEQGLMYKRGVEMGLFSSYRAMSKQIGVNVSTISRGVALAELPPEIVDVFSNPLKLQFRWAQPLSDALKQDREGMLQRARELLPQKEKLSPSQAYARLITPGTTSGNQDEPIPVTVDGKRLATIHLTKNGVEVRIAEKAMPRAKVEELREMVEGFLSQVSNSSH